MTQHHASHSPPPDGPTDGGFTARATRRVYEPIESAAAKLGLSPEALRARCRRAQRLVDGAIVADLGAGIRAVKFGRTWRVRFPDSY